jgi:hypothetical protein
MTESGKYPSQRHADKRFWCHFLKRNDNGNIASNQELFASERELLHVPMSFFIINNPFKIEDVFLTQAYF